ncbi:MupA/Atu3671 family FMN-dependent luciferase-like monooxygenase [Streptomyces sp. NPDC001922]|uniref:MupA/Atu3671 family FMN-dependent luciferase-like monooxygenase n=1 Tax=Streptomyces sp. NPDC001922 TaxID=3364624 RepID=UPI003679DCAC
MAEQLSAALPQPTASRPATAPRPTAPASRPTAPTSRPGTAEPDPGTAVAQPPATEPAAPARGQLGPRMTVSRTSGMASEGAGGSRRAHVDDLVRRYTARTPTSKKLADRYRRVLADSRAVVGFRSSTKEMLYPIAGRRSSGSSLEDVDGNRYVDITMGFGTLLFGHEPPFVREAVREHLGRGMQFGARNAETGEAAELLAGLTGMDRVAFANSGTEANAAAIRLARAATGRTRIVTFHGAYHGHADNVLGRSSPTADGRLTVPVSTGIPRSAVADLMVLDYGRDSSLEAIERHAADIAAVVVEPVQSRNPALRPVEFVRRLREVTSRHGIVLLFDEMLTGFRPAQRGAQELYGVTPDLATYGKLLGSGFPIGAIAGRPDIMDGIDGGFWQYGDDSYPERETTFFGGTYIQHPVSMVAATAVLTELRQQGPGLQERLNARTDALAASLNAFFEAEEFPLRMRHFGSMFRFEHQADMELLYHHLMLRGVFVWEWRNFFLSTAHSDEDVAFLADAVRESLRELRRAGFFTGTGRRTALSTGGSAQRPVTSPGAPASAPAATASPATASPATVADAPVTRTEAAPAGTATEATAPAGTGVPTPPAAPARERARTVALNTAAVRTAAPVTADAGTADGWTADGGSAVPERPATGEPPTRTTDFSLYYFGDYPEDHTSRHGRYEHILRTARYADEHGFHALWMPERHFHAFGGLFPNPAVLASALARETSRIRLNAGSVVLPLHDPIRVAEEWSMVDNLSGGRIGIGCASGWHANDFAFFPDRYGRHKETMYEQVAQVRRLWRGDGVRRRTGDGDQDIRIFPAPVQGTPPMFTAVVGNPDSYRLAARHDLGIVTNLMAQSVEQLAENIALYRRTRAEHSLDPDAGRVAVLLHTYLHPDHTTARTEAYGPLSRYMRSSLSLFGGFSNSLGHRVDLASLSEDDLDTLFRRAYDRYCDQRALIGTAETAAPVVTAVRAAGADEIASLIDFGVAPDALYSGLAELNTLRRTVQQRERTEQRPDRPEAAAREQAVTGGPWPTRPAPRPGSGTSPQSGTDAESAPEPSADTEPVPKPGADRDPVPVPHAGTAERPGTRTAPQPAADAAARADRPHEDDAPLSSGQQRIWFLERMLPGRTAYNEVAAIDLAGPLDLDALRSALDRLVARHASLRTVFRETGGEPRQIVSPPVPADFEVLDRRGDEAAVRTVLTAESARRFDLAQGPLFVARLVATADDHHVLVLSMHHIVVDAASATVLARDLSAFYRAATTGTSDGLPALTRRYTDHVRARLAEQDTPDVRADLAYWTKTLGGTLPETQLPTRGPRPGMMTSNGRAVFRTLDAGLSERLRALGRTHRSTLFMVLLAGYGAMLNRVTGQRDIIIGSPVSDRPRGTEDLVGFFVNTLALRLDLSGDPDFGTLLRRVRGVALDAYDHAAVPFEDVVRALGPSRGTDRTPVFQVMAEFESEEPFRFDLPGVRATALEAGPDKALTDLTVYFTDRAEGIRCHIEYNTDLFDAAAVDGFFDCFHGVLTAAVDAPDTPLSRLTAASGPRPVPTADVDDGHRAVAATEDRAGPDSGYVSEGDAVPGAWENGPVRTVDATTVHELVLRRAAETPSRTAVVSDGSALSYGQLADRSARLAAAIGEAVGEAGPDGVVALWLPRSPDLIVAMLAALRAGYGYLALDPAIGRARAESVLAGCAVRAVVSDATHTGTAPPAPPAGAVLLDIADRPHSGTSTSRPASSAAPGAEPASATASGPSGKSGDALCYVVHTSGTTGPPKGVAVTHHSVVSLCQWYRSRFGLRPGDRSALVCSQSFDGAVLDIWPALTTGASVAVADDRTRLDPVALARWYGAWQVTHSFLPTALGEALTGLGPDRRPMSLRHLLVGGDTLRNRPAAGTPYEVVNIYGPTETTVLCTTATVAPEGEQGTPVPIGRPVDNVRLSVLGAAGEPVPVGTVGELYVGGAGLARGYLGRPEETERRFVTLPGSDGRWYRTGDRVRWTPGGVLEFHGRTDDQVKIRGFRVEPDEVTRMLAEVAEVREAVVLARRNAAGEAYLAAFVVPAGTAPEREHEQQRCADRLADLLADRLPEYLVPRAWAVLPSLPLTGHGKLDRAALPATPLVTGRPGAAEHAERSVPNEPTPPAPSRDSLETRLRELWAAEFEVEVDAIGPDTSFFDLGGHSITAIRLLNSVWEALGTEYPMARFYQEPTVRAMAAELAGPQDTGRPAEPEARVGGLL